MITLNKDHPHFMDLTLAQGDKVSVNALQVIAVFPLEGGSCEVTAGGSTWAVQEGPGEVLKTINSIRTTSSVL